MSFQKLKQLHNKGTLTDAVHSNNDIDNVNAGLNIFSDDKELVEIDNQQNFVKEEKDTHLSEMEQSVKLVQPENMVTDSASTSHDVDLDPENRTVFVGNISYVAKEKEIKKFLSKKFGTITRLNLVKTLFTKRSKGIAFVTFANHSEALAAVNASEKFKFKKRSLRILWSKDKRMNIFKKETEIVQQRIFNLPSYSEEDNGETTSSILTEDALLEIFSYFVLEELLEIKNVCSRWNYIISKRLASKRKLTRDDLQFSFEKNNAREKLKTLLHHCASNLIEFDPSPISYVIDHNILEIIVNNCRNLEKVNFSNCPLYDEGLKLLATNCPKLTSVTLGDNHHFGEKGLWWLLHKLPNLKYLDVSNNTRITGKCFFRMGSCIETLILNSNSKLCNYGFKLIASKCLQLKHLSLISMPSLNDKEFEQICKGCPLLNNLTVTLSVLTPSGLSKIALLPLLEVLNISNCCINDFVLIEISRSCPNLKILNISGFNEHVSDNGVKSFQNCKKLQQLIINKLEEVTDISLSCIAKNQSLQLLQARGCPQISQEGCIDLLNLCPRLRELDISGCFFVGNGILTPCLQAVELRNNNIALKVIIGGTNIDMEQVKNIKHPLLSFLNHDFSYGTSLDYDAFLYDDAFDYNGADLSDFYSDIEDYNNSFFDSDASDYLSDEMYDMGW